MIMLDFDDDEDDDGDDDESAPCQRNIALAMRACVKCTNCAK